MSCCHHCLKQLFVHFLISTIELTPHQITKEIMRSENLSSFGVRKELGMNILMDFNVANTILNYLGSMSQWLFGNMSQEHIHSISSNAVLQVRSWVRALSWSWTESSSFIMVPLEQKLYPTLSDQEKKISHSFWQYNPLK